VEEAEARKTVDELVGSGWVDDRRFSAAVARSEAAKGKGPMAVMAKLRRRGVRADLSEARRLFEGAAASEVEAVQTVLSRRFAGIDRKDRKALARVYQALLRRGFSPASIQTALKAPVDDEGTE
jgi:regulatory protein